MADQLLALSFLQPWLWAILEGYKGFRVDGAFYAVENRPWKPWPRAVGRRIALHASLGHDADGARFVNEQLAAAGVQRQVGNGLGHPRGAILGTAVVAGAVRLVFDTATRQPHGQVPPLGPVSGPLFDAVLASPWAFGEWVWLLGDVQKLPRPLPCRGALGLWRVPADVAQEVPHGA